MIKTEFIATFEGEGPASRGLLNAVELQTAVRLVRTNAAGTAIILEGARDDVKALVDGQPDWTYILKHRVQP